MRNRGKIGWKMTSVFWGVNGVSSRMIGMKMGKESVSVYMWGGARIGESRQVINYVHQIEIFINMVDV